MLESNEIAWVDEVELLDIGTELLKDMLEDNDVA